MSTTSRISSSPDAVPLTRRRRVGQRALNPPRLPPHTGAMDDAVRDYIDAIVPQHRPLFDRLHRLILEAHPDAAVVLSYQLPTYKAGRRRLFVGVWKHGVSSTAGSGAAWPGSATATPSSRPARGPSSCGPIRPPASPTRSSATWCAPTSTADHAPPATHNP
jgi:hypothetical protein